MAANSFTQFATGQTDPMKNKYLGTASENEWNKITFGGGVNPNMRGGSQAEVDAWEKARQDGYSALAKNMGVAYTAPAAPAAAGATASQSGGGMLQSASTPSQTNGAAMPATTAQASNATDPGLLSTWYADYMKSQPKAETATTTNWAPDANQTVQGQVANITDSGSPLMDRAATKAMQTMNGRGLLNSSMAVQAGQAALYDAALPIAQQDANTFATAGKRNADAADSTSQFNATAQNKVLGDQVAAGVTGAQQEAGFRQQTALQTQDIASQQAMQVKDLASRYDLANLDANARAQLQQQDAALQKQLQTANATLQTNLATQSQGAQKALSEYQLAVQQAMSGQDNATKLQLQALDAATQTSLADLNNKYRAQLQTSDAMSGTFQQLTNSIAGVMVNADLDAAAKQTAINNLTTLYNSSMDMQSKLTGLDLGSLLAPASDTPTAATPATTPGQTAPRERTQDDLYPGGRYFDQP